MKKLIAMLLAMAMVFSLAACGSSNTPAATEAAPAAPADSQPTTLESRERQAIAEALARNGGRRKESAEELNISLRTLYRKIKEYGLE